MNHVTDVIGLIVLTPLGFACLFLIWLPGFALSYCDRRERKISPLLGGPLVFIPVIGLYFSVMIVKAINQEIARRSVQSYKPVWQWPGAAYHALMMGGIFAFRADESHLAKLLLLGAMQCLAVFLWNMYKFGKFMDDHGARSED